MQTSIEKIPYILFADDDEIMLNLLKFHIDSRGWKADYVKTARDIVDSINTNCQENEPCYDAVVADINYFNDKESVPRLTGITAAAEIRKSHRDIPIVFLSGFINTLTTEQIKSVNATSMVKPVDIDILFAKLEDLIKWNRAADFDRYIGNNRRRNSVNRTNFTRRSTDTCIRIPKVLENVIEEVRTKQLLGTECIEPYQKNMNREKIETDIIKKNKSVILAGIIDKEGDVQFHIVSTTWSRLLFFFMILMLSVCVILASLTYLNFSRINSLEMRDKYLEDNLRRIVTEPK